MENNNIDWFSLTWFELDYLQQFEWVSPFWFWVIPFLPLLFILRWLFVRSLMQQLPIALTRRDLRSHPITYLRFVPPVLFIISMALFLIGLARPQTTHEEIEKWSEGIDIVLTIDISESMQIEDFRPNRLEAAKKTAKNFVEGRFQDRIGLVIFSGDAIPACPLTIDYDVLHLLINEISFDRIPSRGTAIGNAIASVINLFKESDSESKVMILLSDGDNTAGNIDPIKAAELAAAFHIKTYVIAIGKTGKVPFGKDFFGRPRYIENTFDETTLRKIAQIGNGKFYRVSNQQALNEVFQEIDQLEKVEIKESKYKETKDFYYIYVRWGVLFFLLWLFTKSTFITHVISD